MLFALQRMDVFPAGDIALAAAAAELKGLDARPDPRALRALAEAWRPARGLTRCAAALASLAVSDGTAGARRFPHVTIPSGYAQVDMPGWVCPSGYARVNCLNDFA